jgi:hypothetical protein
MLYDLNEPWLPGFEPTEEEKNIMDKKINKILKKEKDAIIQTKQLLKMDKKQDRKIEACGMKKK